MSDRALHALYAAAKDAEEWIDPALGYVRGVARDAGEGALHRLRLALHLVESERGHRRCEECGGSGELDIERGGTSVACPDCDGSGEVKT